MLQQLSGSGVQIGLKLYVHIMGHPPPAALWSLRSYIAKYYQRTSNS